MDWKDDFIQTVLIRGKELFRQGHVDIEIEDETISGVVHEDGDYTVNIVIDEFGYESMNCDCPDSETLRCQHMAALMYAFEAESQEFYENMRHMFDDSELDVEEIFNALDKDALVECLSFIYERSEEGKVLANVFLHNHFGDYYEGFEHFDLDDHGFDLSNYEASDIHSGLDMFFDAMVADDYDEDLEDNEGIYRFIASLEEAYTNSSDDDKRVIFDWMVNNYYAFEEVNETDLYFSIFENVCVDALLHEDKLKYLIDVINREVLPFEEHAESDSAISALFDVASTLKRFDIIEGIYAEFGTYQYVFGPYIQYLLEEKRNEDALKLLEEDCSFLRRISRQDFETCGLITSLAYDINDIERFKTYFETLIKHYDWVDVSFFVDFKKSFTESEWNDKFLELHDVMKGQQNYPEILSKLEAYDALFDYLLAEVSLTQLLEYESELRNVDPNRVVDCYLKIADENAKNVGRQAYKDATEVLMLAMQYENAKPKVKKTLESWKRAYPNRHAMIRLLEDFEVHYKL